MNRHVVASAVAGFLLLVAAPGQASVTIRVNRIAPGNTLPGVGPSRLSELCAAHTVEADGSSNFITDAQAHAVVKAAAQYWQNIYSTFFGVHTLTIDWAFVYPEESNIGANAGARLIPRSWSNGRVVRASIGFDAGDFNSDYDFECNPTGNNTIQWFVDRTPNDTVEYDLGGLIIAEAQPRGANGFFIETVRNTVHTDSFPVRLLDMYSVALHEIGHALGFIDSQGNNSKFFLERRSDSDIDVVRFGSPWTSTWPVNTQHFSESNMQLALMGHLGDLGWGRRLLPTQADILCIAQLNAWGIAHWGPTFFDYWN